MNKDIKPHLNKEIGFKRRHGTITYPDKIGQYTIKNTIGEGSYSLVKLVYHELNDKYYACKIVPIKMLKKNKLYERFELEIRISQIMRHPGVSAITDVLKDEYNFYIFMEYYPNGNLNDYIVQKTRLPEEEAKALIYQLFDALEYINSQGVAHRDIKPDNIIFDNNGHIRLSDFGLSQYVGENNLVKTACGSPCYVSPEIIRGIEYDGFLSDAWSCGVILYMMVTGCSPWTEKIVKNMFLQIRIGDYQIPDFVSKQCESLILMLLRVDPKKRITIQEAKRHTWFNIKCEDDEKKLLNYSIPIQFLKYPAELIVNNNFEKLNNKPHELPYVSTKKVDAYFRPDDDDDLDYHVNNISNIHAINKTMKKTKCDVSSPQFKLTETIKILSNSKNNPIKFRRRFSDQYNSQTFDLGTSLRKRSNSTGNLNIIKKLKLKDGKVAVFHKENSEVIIKKNLNTNESKRSVKKANVDKFNRKSARIPKPF